jgi:hypothetical protein
MIAVKLHDNRTVHPNCVTAAKGEPTFTAEEQVKTTIILSRKSKLIKHGQRCAQCHDTI